MDSRESFALLRAGGTHAAGAFSVHAARTASASDTAAGLQHAQAPGVWPRARTTRALGGSSSSEFSRHFSSATAQHQRHHAYGLELPQPNTARTPRVRVHGQEYPTLYVAQPQQQQQSRAQWLASGGGMVQPPQLAPASEQRPSYPGVWQPAPVSTIRPQTYVLERGVYASPSPPAYAPPAHAWVTPPTSPPAKRPIAHAKTRAMTMEQKEVERQSESDAAREVMHAELKRYLGASALFGEHVRTVLAGFTPQVLDHLFERASGSLRETVSHLRGLDVAGSTFTSAEELAEALDASVSNRGDIFEFIRASSLLPYASQVTPQQVSSLLDQSHSGFATMSYLEELASSHWSGNLRSLSHELKTRTRRDERRRSVMDELQSRASTLFREPEDVRRVTIAQIDELLHLTADNLPATLILLHALVQDAAAHGGYDSPEALLEAAKARAPQVEQPAAAFLTGDDDNAASGVSPEDEEEAKTSSLISPHLTRPRPPLSVTTSGSRRPARTPAGSPPLVSARILTSRRRDETRARLAQEAAERAKVEEERHERQKRDAEWSHKTEAPAVQNAGPAKKQHLIAPAPSQPVEEELVKASRLTRTRVEQPPIVPPRTKRRPVHLAASGVEYMEIVPVPKAGASPLSSTNEHETNGVIEHAAPSSCAHFDFQRRECAVSAAYWIPLDPAQ